MYSPCCDAPTTLDGWGHHLCTRCWSSVAGKTKRKDIIAWCFPPEKGPRPRGEAVFVRYGRRIVLTRPGAVRGHPDSWSWSGA